MNILIVDDDPDDQDLLIEAFKSENQHATFTIAYDGKEVLNLLEVFTTDEIPQLIVLDYNMPRMNGAEVLQYLCANKRFTGIPKVIFTTSGHPAQIKECMDKGATDFCIKPNGMDGLKKFVQHALRLTET